MEEERQITREQLLKDLQSYGTQHGKDISGVISEILPEARGGEKSEEDNSSTLAWKAVIKMIERNDATVQEHLTGSSKKQQAFNDYIDRQAEKLENTQSSAFDKFVSRDIQVATRLTQVGSYHNNRVDRPRGDSLETVLTYAFPNILDDVSLPADTQKLLKRIKGLCDKGNFKERSLDRAENYLHTKALGINLHLQKVLEAILEPLWEVHRDHIREELEVLQTCLAFLKKSNHLNALAHSGTDWSDMAFEAKVALIADCELKYPFTKGGKSFGSAIHPGATVKDMHKAVTRKLFSWNKKKRKAEGLINKTRKKFKGAFSKEERQNMKDKTMNDTLRSKLKSWVDSNLPKPQEG